MPNFPFSRAKSLGWSLFEVLTSAQMNVVDANAAQAADGLVWTDVAAFRNWGLPQVVANSGNALFYNSVSDVWVNVGVTAGTPKASVVTGASGLFAGISTGSPSGMTARKRAADYNPTADVGLVGGLPSASSNKKYVIFPTAFTANMTTTASSQTNTTAVACLKWVAPLNLWVSGHEGTGVVETSPDGVTFTSRTVPNAEARSSMAYSPTGTIVITSGVSSGNCIQSTDGINWTQRTMPSTKLWTSVVYVPLLGKFIAIGEGGGVGMSAVASSTDGITWSSVTFTLPANVGAMNAGIDCMAVAFGRTVYYMVSTSFVSGICAIYSQDGGLTWKFAAGFFPASSAGVLASNGKQLVYADGTSTYMTLGTGF